MKYIKDKDWDTYLLDYLENIKKNIQDIPKNPNKGIQFEVLVEYLLSQMFTAEELCFKNTKLSHDGNKDFWAIDAANEVWWAECKNYTPNIALTQLAPTLIMAEINQVSHLMFFSYSSLNANLKKRIAQYSYKYNKEIFLYDDESLEQLIFLYDKEIIHKKYAPELYKPSEKLEIIFFNEINASVVMQNTFDENYEIKELNVGSIYDLNVIFINRYQNTELKVKVTVNDHETNLYFDFLNKDLSIPLQEWEDEIILKPNQIALAKYSVLVKKENKKLALPQLLVSYEEKGKFYQEKSLQNKQYTCNWNKKVVLIGKYYEKIINNFSCECKKKLCIFLVYGTGGTGKTRILEECKGKLINNHYNIINFIGFDNGASWKDIVVEIAFQVFGLEKNLASYLSIEMEDIVLSGSAEPLKTKIIKFLRLLKREQAIDNLEDYYEVIFSEMSRNKYAIIIDNLQSYSSEILLFLKKMIQFLGTHTKRKNSFALLMSLNTALVYENEYLDFIVSIQRMACSDDAAGIFCENITGFTKEEQAIAYLQTLLCLDEYPLNYRYLKETLAKSSLKPKYIELVAGRLFQEECVQLKNNKGIITDTVRFEEVLDQIPSKYEDAFCSNYRHLLSSYSSFINDFEDVLACIYFFNVLTNRLILLFHLNRNAILELCKRDIIKKSDGLVDDAYEFEHDLVEMTICEKIYPNLMEHAISFIMKSADVYQSTLKDQYEQYILCKLFSKQISKEDLISIYEQREQMKINNKFIFKFYLYFINNLIDLKKEFTNKTFIHYMCNCCKYVRDHISETKAEYLFELAYAHLKEIPRDTIDVMKLYFSFIIHFCENKIRLFKVSDCLIVYREYYKKIEKCEEIYTSLSMECAYAKAYLDNRIFVCGKLENHPRKYLNNWASSVRTSHKKHFWDIQLENYFDLANIYLRDNLNIAKALYNLNKGFDCYKKLAKEQQQKYSVNFYSKKILYFLLTKNYYSSLNMIKTAMTELEENKYINYHIFFQEKYKKYEIINLMLLNDYTNALDRCMEEYEQFLRLTGHLQDNFEWIFLQAKYAFYIKNNLNFENLLKKYYKEMCIKRNSDSQKNYSMLKELAIKYRIMHKACDFINERAAGLSEINKILKMDIVSFQQFYAEYKSTAPITSVDYKEGYPV